MREAELVRGARPRPAVVQGPRPPPRAECGAPAVRGRPRGGALRQAAELCAPGGGPPGRAQAPPLVQDVRPPGRGRRDEAALRGGGLLEAALVRDAARGAADVVQGPRAARGAQRRGQGVRARGVLDNPVLRDAGRAARLVSRARPPGGAQRPRLGAPRAGGAPRLPGGGRRRGQPPAAELPRTTTPTKPAPLCGGGGGGADPGAEPAAAPRAGPPPGRASPRPGEGARGGGCEPVTETARGTPLLAGVILASRVIYE